MESIYQTTIASRGWHYYGKNVWKSPKVGEVLSAEKEVSKEALSHDPYSVAWKKKSKVKLVPDTVGHLPREISRATWFFIGLGGKVIGKVFESKYRPSPIPKGGLEILLKVSFSICDNERRFLNRLRNIIESNYQVNFEEARPINDGIPTSIVEDFDDDSEEDFLVDDDGDDDIICID